MRDKLFREVVSNLLIHREFGNRFPAKLIIKKEELYTENRSLPNGCGVIDPYNFTPYPKNPIIARFFKEIGRVDELGSGVKNVFRYTGIYTPGAKPQFIEGDVFKMIIPLVKENGTTQKTTQIISDKILALIEKKPSISRTMLARELGNITQDGIKYHLEKLKEEGKIERVGGKEANGKYYNKNVFLAKKASK